MRRKKNIILNSRNITPHFTGKEKIITLVFTIIMLTFANIINISALSYRSNVGVSFTFNPTLSINISPSNLTIDNLTPGTTSDSNVINISVATNAAYGYTLSAIMDGNNSNLTHNNGANVFSSITTDAGLSSLTTDNTWGYSYKLSNDTNWNNYSGLSTETSKTLVDSNDQTVIPIDFKIAAKASNTQASGTYTGTINFTTVTKPKPISLADAYASAGKTMHNGYYVMQDMTSAICNSVEDIGAQLQVIDIRDDKVYWISKLADNHCWMTQNLDLDLSPGKPLTSYDSDLSTDANVYTNTSEEGPYALKKDNEEYGYIYNNGASTWIPERSTIAYNNLNSTTWQNSLDHPYSYDYLDANGNPVYPDTDATKKIAGNHGFSGNYYNWSATIASNNSSVLTTGTAGDTTKNPKNSICPKNWRLPIITYSNSTNEFAILNNLYNNGLANTSTGLVTSPLWLIKAGSTSSGSVSSNWGFYRSSTVYGEFQTLIMRFGTNNVYTSEIPYGTKESGFSIRCLAR